MLGVISFMYITNHYMHNCCRMRGVQPSKPKLLNVNHQQFQLLLFKVKLVTFPQSSFFFQKNLKKMLLLFKTSSELYPATRSTFNQKIQPFVCLGFRKADAEA